MEQTKNEMKIKYLKEEAQVKKELMAYEFELNSQIENMKTKVNTQLESERENRRDARIDRQAGHQKQMIDQRKKGESFKKFESSGNDIVTGGAGIDKFGG